VNAAIGRGAANRKNQLFSSVTRQSRQSIHLRLWRSDNHCTRTRVRVARTVALAQDANRSGRRGVRSRDSWRPRLTSNADLAHADNVTSESRDCFSGLGRDHRRMRSKEATAERLKKTRASVNTSGLRFHRTACRGRPPGNCEVIPRNERRALELFCLTDGRAVSPDVSPTPSSSTGAAGSNSFLRTDQPGGSCDDAGIMCRQFHKA